MSEKAEDLNVFTLTEILSTELIAIANTISPALSIQVTPFEPRGGCSQLFSGNADRVNEPLYFMFVAWAPGTPQGRMSLGRLFVDVGDSKDIGLYVSKRSEIRFDELEHVYQAYGYYDVKDGVLEDY